MTRVLCPPTKIHATGISRDSDNQWKFPEQGFGRRAQLAALPLVVTTSHNVKTAFWWKSPLRWDEQRCKFSSWSHLYKRIERDIQIIFKSFHFRWVCSTILHCEKMTVNPFVGNRYSHFLPNLMISSSLPSAGSVRQRTNFRVYSSISSSLQLGVANKKSMRMVKPYLR